MTEDKPKCNVDDILCQLGVLSHLRGMQTSLGSEDFKSKFPEFEGWDETIVRTIKSQEADLSEALKDCNLSSVEELGERRVQVHAVIEPPQITETEEAPEE